MPEASSRKTQARRGWLLLGLLLVAAGVLLLALWAGLKIRRVYTCVDSSRARLRAMQDLMLEGFAAPAGADLAMLDHLGDVGGQLYGLQDDLVCLQAEAREFLPLAPLLGWLPEVGPDIASAPRLLDMAQALVNGGVLVFDGLSPLFEQVQPGVPPTSSRIHALDLPQAVAVLDAASPSLASAQVELERAAELRAGLVVEALSPRLGSLLELTDRYLPLLNAGVRATQLMPELLGAEEARTYLILAQNDDERRPTGGWISGMGLVTIAQGRITAVNFQDSWSVDNLEVPHDIPPGSMYRTLWAGIWLFRDANWSPDFPTSAQVAEDILRRDQGISVDGVIAVNQQALRLLVSAMEPLAVASSEEPITGANVLAFIREAWTEPEEGLRLTESWQDWTVHRKDFMARLVEAMLDRVQNQPQAATPGVDLASVAAALLQGLQERHILVYLHDVEAADLLASQQWDGALLETRGDYLQVVDANVGFNKVDPNVQREIHYQVDLSEPDQPHAEAVVHYENKSQRALKTCLQEIEWLPTYSERMHGCYWDYVRFYVPVGARLLTSESESLPPGSLLGRHRFAPLGNAGPDTGPVEKGKVPFGLFFVVGPGEEREVRLAWSLPPAAVEEFEGGWRYQLLVQKQSGTPSIPLRVTVLLPPSAWLVAASPEPSGVGADTVTFDLFLGIDQSIEVLFQSGDAGEP